MDNNLEDKINTVLSDPAMMEKVMGMVGSLGGLSGAAEKPQQSDLLSALDPNMLGGLTKLLGAYSKGGDPRKAALLQAVKPYLRPERQRKVDRALQTLKLTSVAREAFSSDLGGLFGGGR
ncbi:hypothetical protein FACS18949_02600 [Clostridia bacterium]|nr:hypothetical protein FACS18949_02600 [Clostridia bacterium]